ncbi:uncharacterized protein LOC119770831 [Culex quinquefasciatus]|uniref:uncharacterized protein LOC119770831 n=1 Tax=Culex quinquefasciatus TaxID=7176 RepID=UPI0018E32B67|nr:uncharacterized protein LOC119770831 [Culex quinquefasciatus]
MVDGVSYAFFADDTGYSVSDSDPKVIKTKLQAAQNHLQEFQRQWRIKINPTKTQAVFFSRRRSPRYLPSSKVFGYITSSCFTSVFFELCLPTGFQLGRTALLPIGKKLQRMQNKLLKMIYNLDPWYPTDDLHQLAELDTIDEFIDRMFLMFRTSCQMSDNPLISAIDDY